MTAPLPANEEARLAALKAYDILNTPPEPLYDNIAQLTVQICGTPMATVTLVDRTCQWFKARVGIEDQGTPRDIAFCAHAILDTEPLIVPDAHKDERFVNSPLVTQAPFIRFYAGFPLSTAEGLSIGALCALDRRPRRLSAEQRSAMKALAKQVMALLDFRRVSRQLADALGQVKLLSGLLPMCAWCKRVRDDQGYWKQIEAFLQNSAEVDVTHSICPSCLTKVKSELPLVKLEGGRG